MPPPDVKSFAAPQVAQGARLAAAGNCAACHTSPGAAPYAGGVAIQTGFGIVYGSNITPDTTTGIGNWSEAAFSRAMRQGIARDGSHLLPAFPYTHFTKLTDSDVQALYAYFMTRPPVVAPRRAHTLGFPFNVRALQARWKLLYFEPGVFVPLPAKSAAWNRGAYLAEGIAHCAACHTPRSLLGARLRRQDYAGAAYEGWLAPALDASNPAPVPWSEQDLYDYLLTGESEAHGAAAGVMAQVVHEGLAPLPDADVRALAVYFADLNGWAAQAGADASAAGNQAADALARAASRRLVDVGREAEPGAQLYLAACAACHYSPVAQPPAVQGSLALSTSITSADPSNFIQTVLHGVGGTGPGPYMPGYAGALSNNDIAQLANYLRRTRSDQPPWADLPAAIAERRARMGATP